MKSVSGDGETCVKAFARVYGAQDWFGLCSSLIQAKL